MRPLHPCNGPFDDKQGGDVLVLFGCSRRVMKKSSLGSMLLVGQLFLMAHAMWYNAALDAAGTQAIASCATQAPPPPLFQEPDELSQQTF